MFGRRKPERVVVVVERPRPSLWQRIGHRGRELVLLSVALGGLLLLGALLPR